MLLSKISKVCATFTLAAFLGGCLDTSLNSDGSDVAGSDTFGYLDYEPKIFNGYIDELRGIVRPEKFEGCVKFGATDDGWEVLGLSGSDDAVEEVDVSIMNNGNGVKFYGNSYANIFVDTNGRITLQNVGSACTNVNLTAVGYELIAPLWNDWKPGADLEGKVRVCKTTSKIVVEWYRTPEYPNNGQASFQAVLDANGDITFHYGDIIEDVDLGDVTVGIARGNNVDVIDKENGNKEAEDFNQHDSILITYQEQLDQL